MNSRTTRTICSLLTMVACVAASFALNAETSFQNVRFDTQLDIDTMTNQAKMVEIDTIGDVLAIRGMSVTNSYLQNMRTEFTNSMVFSQLSGTINLLTDTNTEWQTYSSMIGRIVYNRPYDLSMVFVNGKSIQQVVNELNPIYGKKIAVVGDSETSGAYETSISTTYPNYIAQRNNMMMFQTCCSKLAMPRYTDYNPTNGITFPSLIGNYARIIPGDADLIWIHIGYNDTFDSTTADDAVLTDAEFSTSDETWRQTNLEYPSETRSFKKSFNSLVVHLTNDYPNAKMAFSLPYSFNGENDAKNTFIKERCRAFGIECIEGSAECGFTLADTQYFTITSSGSLKDSVHLSLLGSQRISYVFEQFMKTRMQISPRRTPQGTY